MTHEFPRTKEDKLLNKYFEDEGGHLFLEVPVGSNRRNHIWPKGSKTRRFDGVIFPNDKSKIYNYRNYEHTFNSLITSNYELEVIEVKNRLNRLVIGQIIAGYDMFKREYADKLINCRIICSEGDPALEWVCEQRNIKVSIYEN
ncbi:hypothetical protein SAMN05192559_10856 [Halobacillus karajensis]|uniref:hypothetical protein n=1 Tax=Halobacillus karajensis TaxID=195088 RepID=UPI0008A7EED7|nr:hypothetical protein [Halobacillus karajensis]SEI04205.1 hypothetical protein SAMN05192559_10856 [Halobacillus karajensis]